MEPTNMTTERGLAENLCLSIQKTVERETGKKSSVNVWHKSRNNAWSVNIYVYTDAKSKKRTPIANHGEGWDFIDAVTNLRDNFLRAKSEEHGHAFTNLLEFDMWIDERDKVERNDVGALVEYDVKDEPTMESILEKINELQNAIQLIKK